MVVVATILAEIAGHWVHDLAGSIYAYYTGRFETKSCPIPIYLATFIMVICIVPIDSGLQYIWYYIAITISIGLFVFGFMVITTAIDAYVLNSYPEASGEILAWINAARTVGGFIITCFETEWAMAERIPRSLGIQGAIVAIVVFMFVVSLQIWGKCMETQCKLTSDLY